MSAGGLTACGQGLYAPGPVSAEVDAPATDGGDPLKLPEFGDDTTDAEAPPSASTKSLGVGFRRESLEVVAAALDFQDGTFTNDQPGNFTLTSLDPADSEMELPRGALGFVYRIDFNRLPPYNRKPAFRLSLDKQDTTIADGADLDLPKLAEALVLVQAVTVNGQPQWNAVGGVVDPVIGLVLNNLDLARGGGSEPGSIVIGVLLNCDEPVGEPLCEAHWQMSCRKSCESKLGMDCSVGGLCQ